MATAGALLHGLYLHAHGQITIGQLVAYLGLMSMLGFPMGMSSFTFSLVQLGIVSAGRILRLMEEKTELDQNPAGHPGQVRGEIVFDHVTFGTAATGRWCATCPSGWSRARRWRSSARPARARPP